VFLTRPVLLQSGHGGAGYNVRAPMFDLVVNVVASAVAAGC